MEHETSRRTFVAGGIAAAAAAVGSVAAAGPAQAAQAPAPASKRRSAATVLHSGVVFTGVDRCPPAQAIAIGRDGRILGVGSNADVRRFAGRDTDVVNLAGGFVMPGLHDGHLHPIAAGESLHSVSFGDAALTIPQMQQILTAALQASTAGEPDTWLEVSMWNAAGVLPTGTVVTRQDLDALPTKRPIFVGSSDHHNAWVNSRALALAGITRNTPDPAGGTIVRDASGEPTGLLKDAAASLAGSAIPPLTLAQEVAATTEAFTMLAGAGVTTIMDAAVGSSEIYRAMAAAGALKIRTHMAYVIDPSAGTDPHAVLATLEAFRAGVKGVDRLSSGIAKVFMDGVIEYPAQTAAMLEPYLVNAGTDADPHWVPGPSRGSLYFDQPTINALALTLDKAGWQLHAHTIGDRAVRTALNAYTLAFERHGDRGNRHTLAHLEAVDPADIPRIARAKVLACMQLQWAETDSYSVDALLPYVGAERQGRIYPARTMQHAGVHLTGGTDWPIDAFNPWRPVAQAITRTGASGPALNPAEGLSRFSALSMYTLGAAFQLHQEHVTGTLEPGKLADLVHTDRDLLKVAPAEIAGTQAVFTMIGGEVIHHAASSPAATHPGTAAREALAATGAAVRPKVRTHAGCGCGH
ncbi:MAG: amidohydrolase [Catenulispora sp.]